MIESQSMYDIGYNDYRFSVLNYRFNDPEYIEGYEWAKECKIRQLPHSDGNLLNCMSISVDEKNIPIYIEKPYELYDDSKESENAWPGFNNGDICVITLYMTTREYGGPEEGGWWYNWDHHHMSIPTIFNTNNINMTAKMLIDACGHEIRGDIYSVLGGTEGWIRIEKTAGSAKSTEVPRYE